VVEFLYFWVKKYNCDALVLTCIIQNIKLDPLPAMSDLIDRVSIFRCSFYCATLNHFY